MYNICLDDFSQSIKDKVYVFPFQTDFITIRTWRTVAQTLNERNIDEIKQIYFDHDCQFRIARIKTVRA